MTTIGANVAHMLLKNEVEELLYHEAELLDERRFAEWLHLLTDDIRYWMPMRRNVKFGSWTGSSPARGTTSTGLTRARGPWSAASTRY